MICKKKKVDPQKVYIESTRKDMPCNGQAVKEGTIPFGSFYVASFL